jgi:hypothetical protein
MRHFLAIALSLLGLSWIQAQAVPSDTGGWSGVSPDQKWFAAVRKFPDTALFWREDLDHTRLIVLEHGPSPDQAGYISFDFPRAVDRIEWSPDSRFLVFTTFSPGGHSPWHDKAFVYVVADQSLRYLDDGVGLVLRPDFKFVGAHQVRMALCRAGHAPFDEMDDPNWATVDLEKEYPSLPKRPTAQQGRGL